MMDVASLNLCKELYELSDWADTSWFINTTATNKSGKLYLYHKKSDETYIPAYDLGFLLRKLPRHINDYWLRMPTPFITDWRFDYFNETNKRRLWSNFDNKPDSMCVGNTPEDALCKLAILLFERGILTKQTEGE